MAKQYSQKILDQLAKAGLPQSGPEPFEPSIAKNKAGEDQVEKRAATFGPKANKRGYVDTLGRIWIRDWAHSGYPNHWDVQEDGGKSYFRVDDNGNRI